MKKKYSAPEMEEIKMDDPIVLDESVTSNTGDAGCPDNYTPGCQPSNY